MTNDTAANVAKWTTSTFLTTLGIAALSVALAVAPAEAKKDKSPADAGIADIDSGDPLFLVVSTSAQKVDIYRGTQLVTSSQVSTGMAAHPTFLGAFSILEKQRWHHSNIYSGAPMPWMNRITWSGTALHAGIVPGYPASHGCIRLPYSFAPKLYDITSVGDNVIISKDRPAPALIEHPNLFQPLPPPSPTMVKQEQTKQKQSSNDLLILPVDAELSHPVKLAKAEVDGVTTDVPSEDLGSDNPGHATTLPKTPVGAAQTPAAPAPAASTAQASEPKPATAANETAGTAEDTHTHAIDPSPRSDGSGNHAVAASSARSDDAATETRAASAHALDSDNEDGPAPVAAASVAETPAPAVILSAVVTQAPAVEKAPAIAPEPAPAPQAAAAPAEPAAPAAPAPVVTATAAGIAPAAALVASLSPAPPPAKPVDPAPVIAAGLAPAALIAASVAPAPAPAPEAPAVIPVAATPPAAAPAEAAPQAPAPVAAEPVQVAIATEADMPATAAENKLDAGTKAAAIQAAEPRSTAPLRILVTRRTQRDRIIGVQRILLRARLPPRPEFRRHARQGLDDGHQGLPAGERHARDRRLHRRSGEEGLRGLRQGRTSARAYFRQAGFRPRVRCADRPEESRRAARNPRLYRAQISLPATPRRAGWPSPCRAARHDPFSTASRSPTISASASPRG